MKMKKLLALILSSLMALTVLTACGSMSAAAAIDLATAKQIAADYLGRNVDELRFIEWERDDGKYELELIVDGYEYDFEIGASSGRVLEVDCERLDRWD